MKNILLITLLTITALSVNAAEPANTDLQDQIPESIASSDADMLACLKTYDEKLQAQVMENLLARSSATNQTDVQVTESASGFEQARPLRVSDLFAIDATTPRLTL